MFRFPSVVRNTRFMQRALAPQLSAALTTSSSCNAKEIKFGREGRSAMLKGVEILAEAVAVTLGPKVLCKLP